MSKILWNIGLFLLCLLWSYPADASPLADRIASFPNWQSKPAVQVAEGDLTYPQWFAGTWEVTSTLVDLAAPLAPEVVTPGFESNRQYLNQPIQFQVRFVEALPPHALTPFGRLSRLTLKNQSPKMIADRAFNGFNIARAYLAKGNDNPVLSVKLDPTSPNRQITVLRGNRQLVSTITGRAIEAPESDRFITTEIFQQLFRGDTQPYLNQVETTTDYHHGHETTAPAMVADQITAVYLSPQDPNYFRASRSSPGLTGDLPLEALQERPVALYRYRLEFQPHVDR